jgi:hypothetical protein
LGFEFFRISIASADADIRTLHGVVRALAEKRPGRK